jgi:hypothetical protein
MSWCGRHGPLAVRGTPGDRGATESPACRRPAATGVDRARWRAASNCPGFALSHGLNSAGMRPVMAGCRAAGVRIDDLTLRLDEAEMERS